MVLVPEAEGPGGYAAGLRGLEGSLSGWPVAGGFVTRWKKLMLFLSMFYCGECVLAAPLAQYRVR